MKILQKKKIDELQPAIDTQCDHCGAIYDLMDCTTCLCGNVLCPDCLCENSTRSRVEYKNLTGNFPVISIFDQQKTRDNLSI